MLLVWSVCRKVSSFNSSPHTVGFLGVYIIVKLFLCFRSLEYDKPALSTSLVEIRLGLLLHLMRLMPRELFETLQ